MISKEQKAKKPMNDPKQSALTGGCDCGKVRYEILRKPLYVHCCHCSWCQRESGSAFALNAMVESSEVKLISGQPKQVKTPSPSGRGQKIVRCPDCYVAVWSHYGGMDEWLSFVKVGTLDDASQLPPDIHIFTSTKQPWVSLSDDKPVFHEYYDRKKMWPAESLDRFEILLEQKNVS